MFCLRCGADVTRKDHICRYCGNVLKQPEKNPPVIPSLDDILLIRWLEYYVKQQTSRPPKKSNSQNPPQDQISQLRQQLDELKIQLRELNDHIRELRFSSAKLDAFASNETINDMAQIIAGARLVIPFQQRQQLQKQIAQLEDQLQSLEKGRKQQKKQQRDR
jgi:hypothetical protein